MISFEVRFRSFLFELCLLACWSFLLWGASPNVWLQSTVGSAFAHLMVAAMAAASRATPKLYAFDFDDTIARTDSRIRTKKVIRNESLASQNRR